MFSGFNGESTEADMTTFASGRLVLLISTLCAVGNDAVCADHPLERHLPGVAGSDLGMATITASGGPLILQFGDVSTPTVMVAVVPMPDQTSRSE